MSDVVAIETYKSKHMLQSSWSLWYDNPGRKVSQSNWSDYIKKLNTFHTVEDFWCLHNNISPPSKLALGSNYHLFKNGIEPKWEDPANTRGGKWVLVVPRAHRASLDEFWLRTVLFLIGENFEHCEEICGCVVSVRKAQDKIAIWTSNSRNDAVVRAIGASMRRELEIPEDIRIGYQSHHDSIQHNSSYNNQSLMQL